MKDILRILFTCGFSIIVNTLKLKKYCRHPEKYPLDIRFAAVKKVIKQVCDAWHIDAHLHNVEQFNNYKGKKLMIMNHISGLDPLSLISNLDKPFVIVCKKEIKKMPFIRTYVQAIGALFLDRDDLMSQMKILVKAMDYVNDPNGPDVLIYPEGTRNKVHGAPCLEFKAGTFKMAMKKNVAICPISVYGTFRPADNKTNLSKYPVNYYFDEAIEPEYYKSMNSFEIAEHTKQIINKRVMELKAIDSEQIKQVKGSKKAIANALAPNSIEF